MSQEYKILRGNSMIALVDVVNVFLNEGWQCQGGVFITTTSKLVNQKNTTIETFYQAIVKGVAGEKISAKSY